MVLPESGALEGDFVEEGSKRGDTTLEKDKDSIEQSHKERDSERSGEPLSEGLLTFSSLPRSHWASLPNLELIKVQMRNGFGN